MYFLVLAASHKPISNELSNQSPQTSSKTVVAGAELLEDWLPDALEVLVSHGMSLGVDGIRSGLYDD